MKLTNRELNEIKSLKVRDISGITIDVDRFGGDNWKVSTGLGVLILKQKEFLSWINSDISGRENFRAVKIVKRGG